MVSRIILGVLALAIAVVLLLSDRPWHLTSRPRLIELGDFPDGPETERLRWQNQHLAAGIVPYESGEEPPPIGARRPFKLGWAYRETGLLRMPFWAYSDGGFVTYVGYPTGWQVAAVQDGELPQIEALIGRQVSDYEFPWHQYLWGWFLPAGLLAWSVAHRLERRREEYGEA